nr:MAG TPA: hypothetical protein [Caudoviricetes sp.]
MSSWHRFVFFPRFLTSRNECHLLKTSLDVMLSTQYAA